jgi:hypothetical protein
MQKELNYLQVSKNHFEIAAYFLRFVQSIVSVSMNILLWLKSWYLAEKLVFPPEHCRGGMYTSHHKKWKQT